jgi:hypothetical protein
MRKSGPTSGRGDRLWRLSDSRSLLRELGSCWTASKAAIHEIAKKKSEMSDPLPIGDGPCAYWSTGLD